MTNQKRSAIAMMAVLILAAAWACILFFGLDFVNNPNVYPEYAYNPKLRYYTIMSVNWVSVMIFASTFPYMCIESATGKKFSFFGLFQIRNIYFLLQLFLSGTIFWIVSTDAGTHSVVASKIFGNILGWTFVVPAPIFWIVGIIAYFYTKGDLKKSTLETEEIFWH